MASAAVPESEPDPACGFDTVEVAPADRLIWGELSRFCADGRYEKGVTAKVSQYQWTNRPVHDWSAAADIDIHVSDSCSVIGHSGI